MAWIFYEKFAVVQTTPLFLRKIQVRMPHTITAKRLDKPLSLKAYSASRINAPHVMVFPM